MEKKLEVKNLRISFRTDAGKVQAVRGIDFDLYKGETLAIVGESGSGKSVTNKAIIGISAVNALVESGEILYDGMDLLQISEDDFHKLRGDKIAMIFQDPLSALDPINRVGMQLTEAMILKNRANRRDSRKAFNSTIKYLNEALDSALGFDPAHKKLVSDFNKFSTTHLKLETVFNKAKQDAVVALEEVEDLIFHIEKKAVSNFKHSISKICSLVAKSIHKYVCPASILELSANLKASVSNAVKTETFESCLDKLNELKSILKECTEKEEPNYFAIGYYTTFSKEQLPELDIHELNIFARKYLDENYMLAFIRDEKQALQYAFNQTIEKQQKVLELIEKIKPVFQDSEPDKKAWLAVAKTLSKAVEESINKLELVKNSVAYTFKASLNRAINTYFSAGPNNEKEQKRFDREIKKYNAIIARGKTPDYKVVPAKIISLDLARENIIHIIDKLAKNYSDIIANKDKFDVDKVAVEMIDFLKAKAQAVAYKVTPLIAKAKALKLMEEVGIPEPKKRYRQYPFQFSGGMRQRIVIAIALAANPDILICDEPTTALDVTIQGQILELINKIKKERNLSIIFITHDLGVVANMADRIAVMYAGKIVETGTAEDVFYDPRHPYTWALLSSMPDLDTNEVLESIPGTPPNMIYPPKGDAFAARNKYALKIDFEEEPPMFDISETHKAATWLLHPNAPKIEMPKAIADRIARMKLRMEQEDKKGEDSDE